MAWQFHPLLVVFAAGGLVSLAVAGYCWRHVRRYGRSYPVLSIGLLGFNNAVWVFAATFKTASTDLGTSLLFYKLEFLGLLPNTAVAVVLALAYVGKDRWLTRRNLALLGAVPTAFLVLVAVNPGGAMILDPELVPAQGVLAFEHEFPPLFSVHLAWMYGAVLAAVLIIAWGAATDRVPAPPALVGVLALLFPLVAGVVKTAGVYPPGGDGINVAPAASAVGISIFAVALVRYRVFGLIPVGRAQAVEVMADGYVLVGPDGRVLDANPAAAELLDVPAGADLRNTSVSEVLPVHDGLEENGTVDLETEDGTVEVRASAVTRQDQDAGEVLLLQDVTEKRRRRRELERTNERLDQFASTVSHDLRNPLNVAQGRLDIARAESDGDDEHLETVATAHDRMEALIDDLLTLAREGDAVEEVRPVDLAALAETAWGNVETAEARLVVETGRTVPADRGRLQQLLENLFRNAVEHAGGDVTVRVGTVEGGFYVADDGPGIPEEERGRVFEAGYSTAADSTGFGLRIVRDVADAHGWAVRITDGQEGGARFEVTGVDARDG